MKYFKTQKVSPIDYNGLVTEQHLGRMYMTKPVLIDKMITKLYPVDHERAVIDFYEQFPLMEVPTENGDIEWLLQGNHTKNVPLMSWEDESGNQPDRACTNGAAIYMVFPEPYFEMYNVIKSNKNEFQLQLMSDAEPMAGGKYRYKAVVFGSSEEYMPAALLFTGSRWVKFYNAVADTLSDRGARPNFTSPFRMKTRMGKMRMEYEVAGSMIQQGKNFPLEATFPGNVKGWINYQDIITHQQFKMQQAAAFLYGKSTSDAYSRINNKSVNGKWVTCMGSGLFESIAPSNVHYFNVLDLDFMTDVVFDLALGRESMGNRKIKLMTGEYGLRDFSRAVQAKGGSVISQFGVVTNDKIIAPGKAMDGIYNPLKFGAQYTEYYAYNGITFEIILNPMFDDKVMFPEMHPDGGTTESRRMVVIGWGGNPNIYRTRPQGQSPIFKYIPGMRDPFSPEGSAMAPSLTASPIDGYTVLMMDWVGCVVKDPTRLIDFRVNLDF